MSTTVRTLVLSGVGIALVGGLLITAFGKDPVLVDLAEVARGNLVITVDAEGETRVRETYDVSAPITGTLLRIPLEVGDPVTEGETLLAAVEPATPALLDARSQAEAVASLHEAEASVRFAQAEVTRTQADARFARVEYNRAEALVQSGAASLTRLEDASLRLALAEAAATSAEARVSMAEAARDRAQAVLQGPTDGERQSDCCVRLYAPADGVVLSLENKSARPVFAGQKLMSVGDPTNLEVVVDLLSADATQLRPGARATLDRWGGSEPLEAELRLLEPVAITVVSALGIEEQRVDAILDITSAPAAWSGLGEGFSVYARIEEWRIEDAILVPLSGVFQQQGAWFTFVDVDGVAERRAIEIGRRDARSAVVTSGLEPGDRIVIHPPDSIADGVSIAERERF